MKEKRWGEGSWGWKEERGKGRDRKEERGDKRYKRMERGEREKRSKFFKNR